MANALTADATGYLANYYNPAGLAKNPKVRKEYIPIDFETVMGTSAIGTTLSAKSFGMYRIIPKLQQSPGSYNYFSLSSVPGISWRNFCVSFIGNYRFAGLSDGTEVDVDSAADLGATFGVGTNLANNFVKLGVVGKVFLRNQLKGKYAHAALDSDAAIQSRQVEGLGYGADVGAMVTLPFKLFPAFGVVWKDALGTRFTKMNVFNKLATAAPDTIYQDFNAAVSIHPLLAKKLKSTLALEMKHILRNELSYMERLRIGVQIENERSWYFWFGMNGVGISGLSAGLALRLPGGNLELGTYGERISSESFDRRLALRYTISWQ